MQYFHIAVGSCTLKRQDRKAELSGNQLKQQVLENGEEREARLARWRLSIMNVLCDYGTAQCTAEQLTCENPNRRGLRDSIK